MVVNMYKHIGKVVIQDFTR